MAMPMYKIRIIANASITRYNSGEGDIVAIVDGYNLTAGDRDSVLSEIYVTRPELAPASEGSA